MVEHELVADPVDLVGRHPWGDDRGGGGEGLRGDPAGYPHPLDRLGVFDLGPGETFGGVAVDVVRPHDRRRDGPSWAHRVRGEGGVGDGHTGECRSRIRRRHTVE